jgi:multiple sugar transport system substrate-binding protein
MMKKMNIISLSVMICGFLAGCSSGGGAGTGAEAGKSNPSQAPAKAAESQPPKAIEAPAEFIIFTASSTTPEDFDRWYAAGLKKKFPNTKFTQLQQGPTNVLKELVMSGAPMDFIEWGITNSNSLIELEMLADLDPLIKKHNYQLNRFDPAAIADIRNYSSKGELLTLPFAYQPFVLHYNKDIFDKFGIEYPKEGSTWDDLIVMARKLTKTVDGVNYRGLDAGLNVNRMQMQLSLPLVDAKEQKSLVSTVPGWVKMFQTYEQIYGIPGNIEANKQLGNSTNLFVANKTLAMFPHLLSIDSKAFSDAIKGGLRMGVTTYPVFKEAPTISTGFFGQGLYIPKKSRYPDFAFQVMEYLTSDEIQMEMGRLGKATALVNPKVQSSLLEGNPIAKDIGLDVSLVYKLKLAPPFARTEWDGKALTIITSSLNKLISNQADVNTAIRGADEEINKMILANPKK